VVATTYTRALADLRRDDASEYGGKSANLGDLLAAGIRAPDGFAVAADAYRAFVDETGLDGTISAATARARPGDVEAIGAASKAIDEAMRFAPLPEAVRGELALRYSDLSDRLGEDDPPVAVRSSALGEDSEDASHAGQQESFLWVRGIDHVCDAVRDCWVSLFTPHALSYRATRGASPETPAMGVTVQLMVDAEISGVMFTCNPVSGDPSMLAVNASWGLGIAVVSGELTPDDYLVSKVTREVVRRALNESRDTLIGQLTGITADLATIRASVQRFDHPGQPVPEAPQEAAQQPQTTTIVAGDQEAHAALLRAAAGISTATLNVHRDTWAFLVEHAGQDRHFHIPGEVTADGGTVRVDVSGPSLVAALTTLRAVHQALAVDPGSAAIARHLYDRIADTVNAVANTPRTGGGAAPVTITIDDRATPAVELAADPGPDDGPEPGDADATPADQI